MAPTDVSIPDAFALQIAASELLGSPLYAALLTDLKADYEAGGLTYELLHDRPELPLRDALVLRLMGAVHRIVLRGDAPVLAARYPSAGGDGSSVPVEDFLAVIRAHRDEVVDGLGQNVQTNEVARCTSLIVGFAEVARRTGLPLSMFEIGSSAGLISNWDRYFYDTGTSTAGDPASPLRFTGAWVEPFDLSGVTPVVWRRGCDVAPLDPTDPVAQRRLLSFVWPDQRQRFDRIRAALAIAAEHRPVVDRADAGDWLAEHLPNRPAGTAAIVFHSIVWQYLPPATKDLVRDVLRREGEAATHDRPVAWVRLEPAGAHADVRLTLWPGGTDEVLAFGTHHGGELRHPATDAPSVGHRGVG
jgi:hypothetical protein